MANINELDTCTILINCIKRQMRAKDIDPVSDEGKKMIDMFVAAVCEWSKVIEEERVR